MNKNLLWGSAMGLVGISMFIWAAQDSLFQKDYKPTPTPRIHSQEKPTLAPTPSIPSSEKIIKAQQAIINGQFEYASQLINTEESSIDVLNILIESNIGQGLYEEAEKNIKELLILEDNESNISGYIRVLLLKGEKKNAKSILPKLSKGKEKIFYQLIIAVTENDHKTAQQKATELLKYKEYEKIATVFLDVYKTYESFQDGSPHYLTTMLANVLKTLNFHALTVQYIKPTLQEFPEYRDAWIVLGNSYLALKKFDIAERMLEKAVSLDPTHPISPYLLGITLYELGETEDAINQITIAIKNGYSPREKAERHIADMYFSLKKYEESLEHYQYILSDGTPTLSDYTKSIYIALQELQTPQLALSFAENAANAMPENPAALSLKAWTLLEKGEIEEAENMLKNLQKKYGDIPQILLYLAKTYEAKKEYKKSFEIYEQCYEKGNGSATGGECAQKYEELRKQLQ